MRIGPSLLSKGHVVIGRCPRCDRKLQLLMWSPPATENSNFKRSCPLAKKHLDEIKDISSFIVFHSFITLCKRILLRAFLQAMIVLFRVAWVLSGVEGYQANMELRFVSFRSLEHSYFS